MVRSRHVATFTVFTVEDRVDNIYSSEEGFCALYQLHPPLHSPHIHTWQPNSSVCHCNGHFFAVVNTLIFPTSQGKFCTSIGNSIKTSNLLSSGKSFFDVFYDSNKNDYICCFSFAVVGEIGFWVWGYTRVLRVLCCITLFPKCLNKCSAESLKLVVIQNKC